ncbi:hypothetical protein L861_23445 [Litchfieldella anticariensis FP35 = DSM 16096]|uniref:ChrR-like cupin domain-containing protein n=1 Tax=Litchfieldella anticariensis (strain DSM 16096 / CECT 5854 / CIP 108499 / LMG 22089 / FP35) TaxID=1121939 RepID=S2LD97_LITA3|nr:cupin domain-containing protein [Halomonas anticariensis]EPC02771.1 hypothetical protein L861_23445 [Halomonas anticariensis FP35 = DSM 16096]
MKEIFQPAKSGRSDIEQFLVIETESLDWQDSGIPGFQHKVLYREENDAIETMLIEMAPGAFSDSHSHDRREQIYVINGDFYDQNHRYKAGDFLMREPETNHIAGSDGGALILLVFSK